MFLNKKLQALASALPVTEERPGCRERRGTIKSKEFGTIHVNLSRRWCQDCRGDINPSYVATDEAWAAAGYLPDPKGGYACVACLSKRLGRKLTRTDFTDAPVNRWLDGLAVSDGDDAIIETAEACAIAGVSREALRLWRESGRLVAVDQFGDRNGFRYRAGDVRAAKNNLRE